MNDSYKSILFNSWKHHAGYIISQLKQAEKLGWEYFAQEVKAIGNNQMDLYLGDLTAEEIGREIPEILQANNIHSKEAYEEWITETGQQFRLLTLSDESVWTLLWSVGTERYMHIHPARYSLHTRRARGTVLKTVIMSHAYAKVEHKSIDISLINQVRKEILGLSPIQHLKPKEGLGKMLVFFQGMIKE